VKYEMFMAVLQFFTISWQSCKSTFASVEISLGKSFILENG
jgi:hypothetical protein